MAGTLRIALAQFDFPVGAVASNADRIITMIAEARDVFDARLVLFPELALCGYPPEDLLLRPSFLADCEAALRSVEWPTMTLPLRVRTAARASQPSARYGRRTRRP